MRDIRNKTRIVKLKEIFYNETDDTSKLCIEDIIKRLQQEFGDNYTVEKKAIKDDIDALNENDFCIIEEQGKKNKKFYSHQDKTFEIHELRMLIDAVSSARFITRKETEGIIEKLKNLTSKNLGKKLQNQIHLDGTIKSEDPYVKLYIDKIHTAISENKELNFKYGNYNVKKEFYLHHDGELYSVKPYALVWNNDYYYLVAIDERKGCLVHYRVDRMRNVDIVDMHFKKDDFNIRKHLNSTFNMYPGKVEIIEIQFDNHLINVILDKFGKDANIRRVDDNSFILRASAAVNKGLVRWILTWGSDAKVISPESLAKEIENEAQKMIGLYR